MSKERLRAARCAGWSDLTFTTYDAGVKHGDTPKTIEGIRAHNLYGAKRGCWPK